MGNRITKLFGKKPAESKAPADGFQNPSHIKKIHEFVPESNIQHKFLNENGEQVDVPKEFQDNVVKTLADIAQRTQDFLAEEFTKNHDKLTNNGVGVNPTSALSGVFMVLIKDLKWDKISLSKFIDVLPVCLYHACETAGMSNDEIQKMITNFQNKKDNGGKL